MAKRYLGHLPYNDPLYYYLQYDIQPKLDVAPYPAKYRVYQLTGSNDVYLYEDKYSGTRVVGKFFLSERKRNLEKAAHRLKREFQNLCMMRDYGMKTPPHYVVRPLGCNYWLNDLLVVEYCKGELLSDIIQTAIYSCGQDRLFRKLTALAYFLSTFHNRTAINVAVDFNKDCAYIDHLINKLIEINSIGWNEAREFYWLRDQWRHKSIMWEDRQVVVHGDATPDNFLFGCGLNVVTFDLERTKRADRVFDTGRVAGELKHFFLQATGNNYAAEPFIRHFLWEYACHFPDRDRAFDSINGRIPFYMGATLLRISRNKWVKPEYRRQLITEAKNCLRSF
jgi:aminoglycoside phosphotransferase (APT) family kinase protein